MNLYIRPRNDVQHRRPDIGVPARWAPPVADALERMCMHAREVL